MVSINRIEFIWNVGVFSCAIIHISPCMDISGYMQGVGGRNMQSYPMHVKSRSKVEEAGQSGY